MRTGLLVRVSTPITVASLVRNPLFCLPQTLKASLRRPDTPCGNQKWSGLEMSPGAYEEAGREAERRPLTKSAILCAGAVCS